MPVNKSALIRYRVINRCLLNSRKATREQLKSACEEAFFGREIGYRTIDSDINAMRYDEGLKYFAPIKFNRLYSYYYYDEPGYTIENIPLNDEEYEALLLAAKLLEQFSDAPVFQTFAETVKRVAKQSGLKEKYRYVSRYHYLEFEGRRDFSSSKYLPEVIKAVSDCKVMELVYKSYFADAPSTYIIHPCLLKQYKSSWYLLGYSEEEDKIKTFALDRFISVKVRNDIPFVNKRFNSKNYFGNSFGINVSREDPVEVHLAFTNLQATYVLAYPIHSSQEIVSDNDKEVVIKYFVRPDYEFISQIMAWGNEVKVIKPESLAEIVRSKLKAALEQYS
jgi:predicted DNA-binding transcriptional regulator YafY